MEIIVLDYESAKVSIIEKDSNIDAEEFLCEKGFNLGDCEWMEAEKITLN